MATGQNTRLNVCPGTEVKRRIKYSGALNNGQVQYSDGAYSVSSIVLGFLNLTSQLRCTDFTAFCMQFKKRLVR